MRVEEGGVQSLLLLGLGLARLLVVVVGCGGVIDDDVRSRSSCLHVLHKGRHGRRHGELGAAPGNGLLHHGASGCLSAVLLYRRGDGVTGVSIRD